MCSEKIVYTHFALWLQTGITQVSIGGKTNIRKTTCAYVVPNLAIIRFLEKRSSTEVERKYYSDSLSYRLCITILYQNNYCAHTSTW